jgi:hypothetical protein
MTEVVDCLPPAVRGGGGEDHERGGQDQESSHAATLGSAPAPAFLAVVVWVEVALLLAPQALRLGRRIGAVLLDRAIPARLDDREFRQRGRAGGERSEVLIAQVDVAVRREPAE